MNRFLLLLFVGCWLPSAPVLGADARADFLKWIDRPRVAPAPQIEILAHTNGLVEFHFSYDSEAGQRVPGLLVEGESLTGREPVVIVQHGTGGRKEDELPLLNRLARCGFIAVAIDGRYHGERAGKLHHGSTEYQAAIVRAWPGNGEHPLYYDTVWDLMRLVDYLSTRPDVDASRIGLAGISKGGIETWLTAAVDPRIAVAVPCIGVQSFAWALAHNAWQGRIATVQNAFDTIARESHVITPDSGFVQKFYDHLIPGIYTEFDGPRMLPLIAPRPLLVINSDGDKNCPLPGVLLSAQAAQTAYQADQAGDHFSLIIQKNSGHLVRPASQQALIDWFVRWFKK